MRRKLMPVAVHMMTHVSSKTLDKAGLLSLKQEHESSAVLWCIHVEISSRLIIYPYLTTMCMGYCNHSISTDSVLLNITMTYGKNIEWSDIFCYQQQKNVYGPLGYSNTFQLRIMYKSRCHQETCCLSHRLWCLYTDLYKANYRTIKCTWTTAVD